MKRYFYVIILLGFLASSCEKEFLETTPTNQISDQVIFQTVEGAQTVLDGISHKMRAAGTYHDQFGVKTLDLAMDLMSEDMSISASHWFGLDHQFSNRIASYPRTDYIWKLFYSIIYNANTIIHNIDKAKNGSTAQIANITAQALALRAYAYFQLVQIYQHTYKGHEGSPGVPVYTQPTKEGMPRAAVSEVYERITADLEEAIRLFEAHPVTRRHISDINMSVAKGLRARVALVMEDWETAANRAAQARAGYPLMSFAEYSRGFDNATEQNWMWGLVINTEQSTTYGSWFSHVDWTIMGYCGAGLSRKNWSLDLHRKMNNNDNRKSLVDISQYDPNTTKNWIIPYKFSAGNGGKGFSADYVMMRPEEMLLIEAEARARLSQTGMAQTLLKELRDKRYTSPVTVSATGETLIEEILLERRIELWGEGFAALDLKRLKRGINRNNSNHLPAVAVVMTLAAEDNRWIYQIPQSEMDANPVIGVEHQNP